MNIVQKINDCHLPEDTAKMILRLAVAGTVFVHGVTKLMNPDSIGFIGGLFEGLGLPAFLAYLVFIGEVIAPIMLIVGYQTKIAALLIAITLAVAILLVHLGDIFSLNQMGGWGIELQALMLFGAIAIFGLGPGKHCVDKKDSETVTIP